MRTLPLSDLLARIAGLVVVGVVLTIEVDDVVAVPTANLIRHRVAV
jgi:hypothetical protein